MRGRSFRLGFEPANGHWEIAAFIQNIWNEHYWSHGTNFDSIDINRLIFGRPRTIGGQLTYRFE